MHKAFAKLMYPNERLELEAGPGIRKWLVMPLVLPSGDSPGPAEAKKYDMDYMEPYL